MPAVAVSSTNAGAASAPPVDDEERVAHDRHDGDGEPDERHHPDGHDPPEGALAPGSIVTVIGVGHRIVGHVRIEPHRERRSTSPHRRGGNVDAFPLRADAIRSQRQMATLTAGIHPEGE